jgi:hypothetical protein
VCQGPALNRACGDIAGMGLCRGPDLNRRHMVLQVMFPAIREVAPNPKRGDTWLPAKANGSTMRTASRHFRPRSRDDMTSQAERSVADLQSTPVIERRVP